MYTGWGVDSGLDHVSWLRRLVDAAPTRPYDLLGIRVAAAEKGTVEMEWLPGESALNREGVVHGGYIAVALDEVCGVAAVSASEPATPVVTMSLNVDYIRPLLPGQRYHLIGTVLRNGRQRTLVRGTVTDGSGQLCAHATASLTPNRKRLASPAADSRTATPNGR
ncbi:PaaI family thioesterase [Streptomyces sp. NPDC032161]|uniref:PaaI family thioesterase n=1 Tax=unclassified Streptomyces TaxID=2593676 RepID=UPI0033CE2196